VLLDCGATSLPALRRCGLDPGPVAAVFVSHLHGDHFGGLPFLILDGQFSRRERPLVIAGPPGTRSRVEAAMEIFYPGSTSVRRRFETVFIELAPRTPTAVGPVTATGLPVDHASGAPAYALRVEAAGRTLAYSGDTAWTDALIECADEADLFVCEAYFHDRDVPFHLSHRRLAAEAHRLTCRRLVLTHMNAEMLARPDSEVAWERAHDGLVIDL
jgi:ribonuclease BN (tRNA processing enzyme)